MRLPWGKWRRLSRAIAIMASLALLLQFAAPLPCLFSPPPGLDGICHAPIGDEGQHAPQPLSEHECCHCLACQAGAAAFVPPLPGAQLAAPRWVAAMAVAPAAEHAVRGAPQLAYASRAPPMIG
jgi:hypothetical protein